MGSKIRPAGTAFAAALIIGLSTGLTASPTVASPTFPRWADGAVLLAGQGDLAQPRCAQQGEQLPELIAGSYASLELGSSGSVAVCLPGTPRSTDSDRSASPAHFQGAGAISGDLAATSPAVEMNKQVPVYYRPGELVFAVPDAATAAGRVLEELRRAVGGPAQCEQRGASALLCLVLPTIDVTALAASLQDGALDLTQEQVTPNLVFNGQPLYHGGPGGNPFPAAALPAATSGRGTGVRVAVLDSGDVQTPADTRTYVLTPDRLPGGIDGTYYPLLAPQGDRVLDRQAGHGVFVAGVVQQVAPGAQVVHTPVLDSDGVTDLATLVQAIDELNGIDIVNLSLGGYTPDNRPPVALQEALARLRQRNPDVVVVAAAGGDGSARPFWPAALPEVIAVAGLRRDGSPLNGAVPDWVDVCALGQDISSTFLTGQGSMVLDEAGARSLSGQTASQDRRGATFNGYATWSGSSFAAPQVSGAIAVVIERLRRVGLAHEIARVGQRLLEAQPRRYGCPVLPTTVAHASPPTSEYEVTTKAGVGPRPVDGLVEVTPVAASNLAIAADGSLYLNQGSHISQLQMKDGTLRLVAGATSGRKGVSQFAGGNGGPAIGALMTAQSVATAANGDLLIADGIANVVRRVDHTTGIITVLAGVEEPVRFPEGGFAGDGQDARTAKLHNPTDIAVGPYGDIFIADTFNQRIRRVDAVTNIITTVAGTGVDTFSGDGGPAQQAALNFPSGIAIDAAGGLLIADTFNHRIRRVDPSNAVIDTIAGGPRGGAGGDGGPARQALLSWPGGVAVSAAGTIYIDDGSGLRSIDPQSGVINLLDANLRAPALAGNILYAIDVQRQVVVRLDEHAGRSETLTQSPNNPSAAALGDGQSSTQAHISAPDDVVVDKKGNFFWIEGTRIRGVDASTGRVRTVVGYNPETATGSDAETTGLGASTISGLTIGPDGSLYATILSEGAIYRVDPMSGRTTVVAFVPSASHISFQGNSSLLVSGDDLYRVNTQTGAVRTLIDVQDNWSITDVGSLPGGEIVYSECDLVDAAYLANVCRIQELLVGGGAPRTLAGGGSRDLAGSTGSASGSLLLDVSAMTVDESGAVFYAEREGAWIRRLNPGTGVVSTVAGSGQQGYGDDLEGAPPASFNAPQGLAAVGTGQLYVADTDNDRIRVITPMR